MRIYTFLFQQHIEEVDVQFTPPGTDPAAKPTTVTEHYMVWKIMDYQFGEMIPYL